MRWTCLWWHLTMMTVETYLVRYVIYCSMNHSMAYFPDRLRRQFGQTQDIPILHNFEVGPCSRRLIELLEARWPARVRLPVTLLISTPVVPGYAEWLQNQDE